MRLPALQLCKLNMRRIEIAGGNAAGRGAKIKRFVFDSVLESNS